MTAAVAMTDHDGMRIALDGVASKALRLHDVENKIWKAMHLNRLSPTPFSRRKICGAAWPIKRYITGVLVADLYADCQQAGEEAV